MTEKWLIAPGQERVIDIERASKLKIGLVGGQVDVIAHDEPGIRIEVHNVTVKDLRIESDGTQIEIDHPQIGWDNFLEVFRNFGAGGPKAEISVAVPRDIALTLGVVSAGALVSGLTEDARLNTVSGDLIVDTHSGDLNVNTVSGDVQVRGLDGTATANTVSGSVALTGQVRKATVDSVSGAMLIDATGNVNTVALNSVSGDATVRLDENLAANYVARALSGRITIDGIPRGSSGPSNFAGSRGELSGSFADVRVNTVSGDITVLRRDAAEAPVSFTAEGEDLL
ncbi:MAG: DUF4097 family beta strand repeat protein [Actinobacteria bacterium]|nr:DUF4097 family beta strand repeat protein [Actinomycetota bacterium]